MNQAHGFQLAVADDAANQLLASLWAAKALDVGLDLKTGSYGDIGKLYDHVDITAMAYGDGWVRGSSQGIYLGGSSPLGQPSYLVGRHFQDRVLQKGDNLSFLVEVNGPGGYFTEVGRTIVLGKASAELQDKFAAAKAAQEYSAGLLKPGVPCRDPRRPRSPRSW